MPRNPVSGQHALNLITEALKTFKDIKEKDTKPAESHNPVL